ncbi:MEDS domain-containing protein [Microbispora sp. RL4-1S]|uniref:MEDS domain-containing protein n=1 Tax=Microbispora oryzae TaxID=2806554 RepID=A0A940WJ94_9ACTN|nr:MEDS domain-containing protein [Microbispora oryzae]MBP2702201.1 MEDS domain-containing protein [Microbispora oryzae]
MRIQPGDHHVLAFSDEADLEPVLAPFISEGLAGADKVVYLTDVTHPAVVTGLLRGWGVPTGEHLAAGRLDIRRLETRDPEQVITQLADAARLALGEGYRALRVTAEMSWGLHEDADRLAAFETRASDLFASGSAMAICQYDRRLFDPAVLGQMQRIHHEQDTDLEYEGALLRIRRTGEPPGVRVEGEVDANTLHELTRSLRAAAGRTAGDVHADLAGVSFIDLAALRALMESARTIGRGRFLVLDEVPEHVRNLIELIGWAGTPGLRLRGRERA